MPKLSKSFCIATEGATCDGREISRQDIVDMAATYNVATYTALANMEHIRGFSADPPFCAYGDVVALSTQDVELDVGGKKEKRLALFAQVNASDELIALNAKGQKLYPSVEINPNFASSGKAYLMGLAFTNSPASLGTEIMKFAAGAGDANPFTPRKQAPGNLFSAAGDGLILEFAEASPPATPTEDQKFFAGLRGFFTSFAGGQGSTPTPPPAPQPEQQQQEPANDNMAQFAASAGKLAAGMEKFAGTLASIDGRMTKFEGDFTAFKTKVEGTDGDSQKRTAATGGNANYARTDC